MKQMKEDIQELTSEYGNHWKFALQQVWFRAAFNNLTWWFGSNEGKNEVFKSILEEARGAGRIT